MVPCLDCVDTVLDAREAFFRPMVKAEVVEVFFLIENQPPLICRINALSKSFICLNSSTRVNEERV